MAEQIFNISRIYAKETSCVTKETPESFQQMASVENKMEVKLEHRKLSVDNYYEVVLDISVITALKPTDEGQKESQQEKTGKEISVLNVKQAGVFQLAGFDDKQLEQLLAAHCPEILYPYARHVVSELAVISSLPTITLLPVSFQNLYQQQKAQEKAKETKK